MHPLYVLRTDYRILTLDFPSTLGRLYTLLRGIKKSQDNVRSCRVPITYPILSAIVTVLSKVILGNYDGIMLSCACTMAFAVLLRASEFLVLKNHCLNDSECLLLGVIEINHCDSYVFNLKCSKTVIFRRGVRIPVYSSNVEFCPVKIMKEYISLRRSAGDTNLDPLFITTNGTVLCRSVLI